MIVAVTDGEPRVLTIDGGSALPSGPFELTHRSLQAGLRSWVEQQTHHPLGYVEQLYTFADRDRTARPASARVSISYLGLTREARAAGEPGVGWQSWYRYFPWEDRRAPAPPALAETIAPACAPGRKPPTTPQRAATGSGASASLSASTATPGTRSWCCSATSCCGRPDWCRKPPQAARPDRGRGR